MKGAVTSCFHQCSRVSPSVSSNHRINHDWFPGSGILSWSSESGQRFTQFGHKKEPAVAAGGRMSVAVCLCAVNLCSPALYLCPHGERRAHSHVQSWPLPGGDGPLLTHVWSYFYRQQRQNGAQPSHGIVFYDFTLDLVSEGDDLNRRRCNYTRGGPAKPVIRALLYQNSTWYFQIWKTFPLKKKCSFERKKVLEICYKQPSKAQRYKQAIF